LHQPDPLTPIEETLRTLDDLIKQGKVRYIGCSNLPAWQVVEAQWTSKHEGFNAFVSCQDEYSLVVRDLDRDLIPAAEAYGLGLLPYFPLASGLLTGKYRKSEPPPKDTRFGALAALGDRYATEANWAIVDKLTKFCAERGHSLLELAFSWLAARPTVASVIAGATKPEQVEQNAASANWKLTAEEMAEIDKITRKQ
jgi:aryl-alcohol dehydrogenase-like predicted oxidoreductase